MDSSGELTAIWWASSFGGDWAVTQLAPGGLAMNPATLDSYVTITSGATGTGDGTVTYSLAPNSAASVRGGLIAIGGQSFPILQQANVGGFVLPFANPRHQHEYRVLAKHKLADDQIIAAGVIDDLTNFVEHPEVVADRPHRADLGEEAGSEREVDGGAAEHAVALPKRGLDRVEGDRSNDSERHWRSVSGHPRAPIPNADYGSAP